MTIYLLSLILAPLAQAESYCVPRQTVRASVSYCFQNSYFVDAADRCLEKFDQDVLAHRDRLTSGFVVNDGRSVSAQHSKFRNSGVNLSDTNVSLGNLLDTGRQVRAELEEYQKSLIYVNDAQPSFLQRFGLLAEHQRDPCFRDNYNGMTDRIAKMNQRLADLERTDAKTQSLAAGTGFRRANLDVEASQTARTITHGASQGSVRTLPSGTSRTPASTITGQIKPEPLH